MTNPYPTLNILAPSKVVFTIDNSRFFTLYANLLTRPVPIHGGDDHDQGQDE
jgi:hypothetical protein